MGLDIYFYKVKPSKGVNTNSVGELYADRKAQHKKAFNKEVNKYQKRIKQAIADNNTEERNKVIAELRDYIKSVLPYEWYLKPFDDNKEDNEILKAIRDIKKIFYPQEDVYFRKANFVYRFFSPYLVDEECIVNKDQVTDLLERCNKVIAAAKAEGVINDDGKIAQNYLYSNNYWDLTDEERKAEDDRVKAANEQMPRDWVETAADLLPTQSGFCFGSTEYGIWYLENIISCKEQFTELLANWADDEVVFNSMSW